MIDVSIPQEVIDEKQAAYDADVPSSNGDGGGDEEYRTILEIWREVLKTVDTERVKKVTPQWANRIINAYPEIKFVHMTMYRDMFYNKIQALADILEDHIDSDAECLKRISAEEDARFNGLLYRTVLIDWQKRFLQWELAWDTEQAFAGLEVAALAEVHKMFFDQMGLLGLLDQINLEFTDADRELLSNELQQLKDAVEAQ